MTQRSSGSNVPAYILAGGYSRRFGADKARALVDGETMIERVAAALRPVASSITVVARSEGAYADLGLRTIADVVADRGPLAGLLTALKDARRGWALVTACDWWGVESEWARDLIDARTDDADAVLYRPSVYEPLFALYHTRIGNEVWRRLGDGPSDLQSLCASVRSRVLPTPAGWERARNVNRTADVPPEPPSLPAATARRITPRE